MCEQLSRTFSLTALLTFGWKTTTSSCWPIAWSNFEQPQTATAVSTATAAAITGRPRPGPPALGAASTDFADTADSIRRGTAAPSRYGTRRELRGCGGAGSIGEPGG